MWTGVKLLASPFLFDLGVSICESLIRESLDFVHSQKY